MPRLLELHLEPNPQKETANLQKILVDVVTEYISATSKNGPFNSAHEGYGVILEELDELWDEIKKKHALRSPEKMREEAIQVAAMALRFITDVCDRDPA